MKFIKAIDSSKQHVKSKESDHTSVHAPRNTSRKTKQPQKHQTAEASVGSVAIIIAKDTALHMAINATREIIILQFVKVRNQFT